LEIFVLSSPFFWPLFRRHVALSCEGARPLRSGRLTRIVLAAAPERVLEKHRNARRDVDFSGSCEVEALLLPPPACKSDPQRSKHYPAILSLTDQASPPAPDLRARGVATAITLQIDLGKETPVMFQKLFHSLGQPRAKRRPTTRLLCEVLEDRSLPSGLFGTNLILNGDAESGSGSASGNDVLTNIPGWTPTGNFTVVQYGAPSFPSATSPGPLARGQNFFAGGPDNSSSSASQVIDLSPGASSIDAGGVTCSLSGYLGGYASQEDNAVLTATFQDVHGSRLGTASIGPVTAADRGDTTGLLARSTSSTVPVGTRRVDLVLQMTRTDGSYNDGYADDLSLVLNQANAASQVQFAAGTFSAAKADGTATVTVTRTGSSAGIATVFYATSAGTAVPGQDYVAASGSLTFNPGETSKPITISILSGAVLTGTETVQLTLTNPTGANLGSQATTLLDLADPVTRLNLTGPSVVMAGATDPFTVTALNAAGNPVLGYRGTVHLSDAQEVGFHSVNFTFSATDSGPHAFPLTFMTLGSQTLTVNDAALNLSAQLKFTVITATAQLTLVSSSNPSILGAPVTVTAMVQSSNPAAGTPSGTVLFEDGGVALGVVQLDATGRATFTLPDLSLGSHSLEAVYSGDDTYPGVGPAVVQQTVINQPVTDVTGLLRVHLGRVRRHGLFQQPITLVNVSGQWLEGPISLVFDKLTPKVRLIGATGRTASGNPYLDLTPAPNNLLAPGAALSTTLIFAVPRGGATVHFLLHILAGVGPRLKAAQRMAAFVGSKSGGDSSRVLHRSGKQDLEAVNPALATETGDISPFIRLRRLVGD
jgi:hypothetical protein